MDTRSILSSCQILDMTDEKGRFCVKLLADMGAEVVRIEKLGLAAAPKFANTGKHSINIDIETAAGCGLLQQLVKDTDILVESFPPGYLDLLGLGYISLNRVNSRLIMASITPYGQSGPYRDYKSSELVASAAGGQAYVCGEPGEPPLKPPGPQAYFTAGLFAANGILLALMQRHVSGRGQSIDISIFECMAATLDHVLVRYFYEGVVAERKGSQYWNNSFRVFMCRDGYILLSWARDWETLVEWMDSESLAGDLKERRWLDEAERQRNVQHIGEVLEKWTRLHSVDELVETGQLMRFPWARVSTIPEVLRSPQLKARQFFGEEVEPETGVRYQIPGVPFKLRPFLRPDKP